MTVCIRPSASVRSAGPGALLARVVERAVPAVALNGDRYDRWEPLGRLTGKLVRRAGDGLVFRVPHPDARRGLCKSVCVCVVCMCVCVRRGVVVVCLRRGVVRARHSVLVESCGVLVCMRICLHACAARVHPVVREVDDAQRCPSTSFCVYLCVNSCVFMCVCVFVCVCVCLCVCV